jgi:tRNA G18 (ribose-2'-O)-methylase SpoU
MRKLKVTELNRLSVTEYKESRKLPLVVVLDNVRSLYNVGAVFRTSDAFRVEAIYLCGITARPPHVEIHKTALGAEYSVDWRYFEHTEEAVKTLKQNEYILCAVEQVSGSIMLNEWLPEKGKQYAVVFGNEVKGVMQQVVDNCNVCLEIPQYGTKHSLNVSVSVGIVIWDMFTKLT